MGNEKNALTVQHAGSVVAAEDTEEARERRLKEAEEHDAKLRHIMDTVPIKIKHLQGSSAGAGSGEFHIYRKARTQEQKRMEEIEKKWKEEQAKLLVKRQFEEAQDALDARTAKNRAKRQKRKGKKAGKSSDAQAAASSPVQRSEPQMTPVVQVEQPDVD